MTEMKPELEQHYKKSEQALNLLHHAWTRFKKEDDLSEKTSLFLKNIELSAEQKEVARNNSTDLVIKGVAGSGKSITLLSRMMQKMSEEFNKQFLFVSFNHELVRDAEKRFRESEFYYELEKQGHSVHFFTFHELAHHLLFSMGIKVPRFKTSYKKLRTEEDNILAKMHLVLDKLESDDLKDYPPIHTIKKTKNINFLLDEFFWMKGNGFITKEDYLECQRTGRGKLPNISKKQRETIYRLFEEYQKVQYQLFSHRIDREDYALLVIGNFHRVMERDKYDHIFIDEMQDFQPMQLKVLVFLNKGTLTLSGDERQRIFKSNPFSYRSLGINIQPGNNIVLKTNHRSTYQIMKLANSLQFERTKEDSRYDNEKYFPRQGELPSIEGFIDDKKMLNKIITIIQEKYREYPNRSFVIIHRYHKPQWIRTVHTVLSREFKVKLEMDYGNTKKSFGPNVYFLEAKETKGLEYDYVFILNFNKNTYPHKYEIDAVKKRQLHKGQDISEDMRELVDKEKRILYVCLTRAKQEVFLYYSYSQSPENNISPFIKDFYPDDYKAKINKR